MYQKERLHLILLPCWVLIYVDNRRAPARRDTGVLLDGLEVRPCVVSVYGIACQSMCEEKGFDSFWPLFHELISREARTEGRRYLRA